ncbi:MAG TPA: hypothetical protein VEA41_02155 [Salinarimonas sp.]|nr:hypothetical protein [Salinarimonas sp.]
MGVKHRQEMLEALELALDTVTDASTAVQAAGGPWGLHMAVLEASQKLLAARAAVMAGHDLLPLPRKRRVS